MKYLSIFAAVVFSTVFSVNAYAQTTPTLVPVYNDAFLGSQINSSFWISAGNTTQSGSAVNVSGNGAYGTNGVASVHAYSRAHADLILDADVVSSDCTATGTTGVMGYGDVNPFTSGSGDYLAVISGGTVSLESFSNGALQDSISTGYVCGSNKPFHLRLVALQAGGAQLFINGSSTISAKTPDGSFDNKQVFLQAYQPGATTSYSNFFFTFVQRTPVTATGTTNGTFTGVTMIGVGSPVNYGNGTVLVGGGSGVSAAAPGANIITILIGGDGITAGTDAGTAGGAPSSGQSPLMAQSELAAGQGPTAGASPISQQDTSGQPSSSGVSDTAPATVSDGRNASTGLIPCGYFGKACQFSDLVQLAQNVISFLLTISIVIATILIAYAGYLYLTSAGNSGQVEKATKIFTNIVVGFIIALAAFLIVHTILSSLIDSSSGFTSPV